MRFKLESSTRARAFLCHPIPLACQQLWSRRLMGQTPSPSTTALPYSLVLTTTSGPVTICPARTRHSFATAICRNSSTELESAPLDSSPVRDEGTRAHAGGGVRDGGGARLSRHLVVFAVLISGAALQHLALWQSTKFPHNRVPDTGNLPHVDPPGQEHPLENESSRGASERATTGGGAAVVEGLSSQGASWPGGDVGVGEQEPSDRHRHGRDRDREAGKHRDPKPLHPATSTWTAGLSKRATTRVPTCLDSNC